MHRVLREPLLHFLLLGAVLFGVYGWVNRGGFAAPNEIVVSRGQVQSLAVQFERVWQRAPTRPELQGLIDNWVREEIFYREGVSMGLERDDPVVRRRIQQKLEFIVDSATPEAPTTQDLQRWLDDHSAAYRIEARYSLRQIYFDPTQHGDRLEADVAAVQRALAAGRTVSGDATMLPPRLEASAVDVVRSFGNDFEAALRALPVGGWQGPVRSGFGVHLVELTARESERVATLGEVREAVERDLLHERTREATDAFYQRLRANYAVRVEDALLSTANPTG